MESFGTFQKLTLSKGTNPTPTPVVPDATITFSGNNAGRFADSFAVTWFISNATSASTSVGTTSESSGNAKFTFVTEPKTITVSAKGKNGTTVTKAYALSISPITPFLNNLSGITFEGKKYKVSNVEGYSKTDFSNRGYDAVLHAQLVHDRFTFTADHNVIWWDPEAPMPPTVPEDRRLVKGEFKDVVTDGKQTLELFSWKMIIISHTSTGFESHIPPTFNSDGSVKTFGIIYTFVLAP